MRWRPAPDAGHSPDGWVTGPALRSRWSSDLRRHGGGVTPPLHPHVPHQQRSLGLHRTLSGVPEHLRRYCHPLSLAGRETRRAEPHHAPVIVCGNMRNKRDFHVSWFRAPRGRVWSLRPDLRGLRRRMRASGRRRRAHARVRADLSPVCRVVPSDGGRDSRRAPLVRAHGHRQVGLISPATPPLSLGRRSSPERPSDSRSRYRGAGFRERQSLHGRGRCC